MSSEVTRRPSGLTDADAGVDYTQVLAHGPSTRLRGLIGILLAFTGYVLVVPTASQLVLAVVWLAKGRPSDFTGYYLRAMRYEVPEGLLAGHIALGLLIPLSMLMAAAWHRTRPRWLSSVRPGLRWKYLLVCLPVAAVILNAMMWLGNLGRMPDWSVPHQAWLWLLLICLLSPFQAAGEEYLFRGYLMQGLGAATGRRWAAIVGSALVFALFHGVQNLWLFADRFAFGLLAGWLVVVTGGLEAGIAAHVANNLFAFGYATFSGGVAQARAVQQIGFWDAVVDVVGFGLVALASWWIARRLRLQRTTATT